MAKRLPIRWWASNHMNSISHKKVTAMELRYPRGTFYDTWAEAHDAIVTRCQRKFEAAQRELATATRALAKAKAMKPPVDGEEGVER